MVHTQFFEVTIIAFDLYVDRSSATMVIDDVFHEERFQYVTPHHCREML